jgi:hypothetical protein
MGQDIGQLQKETTLEQQPEKTNAAGNITSRCRNCKKIGHKRAECPGKKPGGQAESAKESTLASETL